jgi:asparagine synthase (glutamine-hydrolysing)
VKEWHVAAGHGLVCGDQGIAIMCGIVGYLNLNGQDLGPDENFLPTMCESIAHRGPDEVGMKIMGSVALGMTRLSIIDLKTGQQPITNEDGSIWIVFNGEIYNFHEIQERVKARGHRLVTASDTETIVHLYEDYGPQCLQYLEGMFAFAIWDSAKQRLFMARDRMGEKPLHWTISQGQFIFSSEIKGILAHPKSKRELNQEALRQYLTLEYVPAPNSIFKDIHKLMPAHYLVVENGRVDIKGYWNPEELPKVSSQAEAQERLLALLDRSIELRLISDVPLGVFLSGGIDSSTIAALAAPKVEGALKTFSIGFSDASFDESEHARSVAHHLGAHHENVQFEPNLALATMTELWTILDEPLGDASIVPTYFLSKMTRRHVTVALAGEGGDELFGGYPTYQAHQLAELWNYLPLVLRENVLNPAINSLPVSLNNLSLDYKLKRFAAATQEPPIRRHLRWMGSIPVAEHKGLLAVNCGNGAQHYGEESLLESKNFTRVLLPAQGDKESVVEKIMRLDLATYLPDDLLVKSDRASMAASLEVRLPFLAYPLVEFALSVPPHMKLKGMQGKYLLRKVASAYLPKDIVKRPKKGFGIPVGKWINNEFKPVVQELLSDSFITQQGIFQANYVGRLLKEHNEGRIDRRKELWTLLMFQWWWRKFFMSS